MHAKNEIVAVARGYYMLPILMSLAKHGIIDRILDVGFRIGDVAGNRQNLEIAFKYLENVGWLRQHNGRYVATKLGSQVLRRCGAFAILYSYRTYIQNLDSLLFEEGSRVHVHRDENVVGSGAAHIRKYFSRIADALRRTRAKVLVDVGCGDGTFLNYARSVNAALRLVGVDYSERALAVTRDNVASDALLFLGNVSEPGLILRNLRERGIDPSDCLVSVWFIFHEVLGMPEVDLGELLSGFRSLAPKHGLIIGEIFDVASEILAQHHNDTAIPEFNFFHDLSGQKLLSLAEWRHHIDSARFDPEIFIGLDPLPAGGDEPEYGSAIWRLRPSSETKAGRKSGTG